MQDENPTGLAPSFLILPLVIVAVTALQGEVRPEGEELGQALGITLQDLREVSMPQGKSIRSVAEVSETKVSALRESRLFTADRDGRTVRLARVPLGPSEPGLSALLALSEEMGFVRAAVVDSEGEVVAEWTHFMEGLPFHAVPRLAGAQPLSRLEELREQANRQTDDESKRLVALLDLLSHMQNQASTFNLPPDNRALDSDLAELQMMTSEYTKVAELTPALESFLGTAAPEFARIAQDSASAATDMAAAREAEDMDAGRAQQRRLIDNCKSCHGLESPSFEGGLSGAARAERERLGIGNGYYRVGHDLRIRHPDRERAQVVASALRRGALLLDAAHGAGR